MEKNSNNISDTTEQTETVTRHTEPSVQQTETVVLHSEPIVKEVDAISRHTATVQTHKENLTARNIVGVIFGVFEILIAFRFLLKLLGANAASVFMKFMDGATWIFIRPVRGLFAEIAIGSGNAVFEPASIIALIVVAIIAWIVFRLMTPKSVQRTAKTSYASEDVINH